MVKNVSKLDVTSFLADDGLFIDVRAPIEFAQGRIPHAINIPLLNDSERSLIGTLYKKQGQKSAMELGVKLIGPKLHDLLQNIQAHTTDKQKLLIYCFRGGLRSSFVAWFVELMGYSVKTLQGGYKAYRRHVLSQFLRPYTFLVLGGFTGSGKTKALHKLLNLGEQVLDLEALALHRGSSYGGLQIQQPSCEQFENEIAAKLAQLNPNLPIWVEDESRMIGRCQIPLGLYEQMKSSVCIQLATPIEARIQNILDEYGHGAPQFLIESTLKIQKRLGFEKTREALTHIQNFELKKAIEIVLSYYDKTYAFSMNKRTGRVITLEAGLENKEHALMQLKEIK